MEPAINVENLPGAEGQQVLRDSRHGPADIFRRAPTWDG